MYAKRSVSTRIAKYLFVVIIFMGIISSLSLIVMASNKSDAEAINISGSLRMQSYRILTEMERTPDTVEQNLVRYQHSLNAKALRNVQQQLFVPSEVQESYQKILKRWVMMSDLAHLQQVEKYYAELKSYVQDVDDFVLELQRFSEQKWIIAVSVLCFSMLLIVVMVSYVIWYLKKEVVKPLELMTKASMQVQMRQFNHIQLDTEELGRLYSRLEDAVNEQTQKLRQTNRSLTTLYQSSQLLTPTKINDKILSQVLNHIRVSEHLRYIELEILGAEHWEISFGQKDPKQSLQVEELSIENENLAVLSWQAGLPCPDPRMMKNLGQMVAKALYSHKTQRQQEQLLLMEERSIIARELHDSLAQVLSFLQIQLTLLKHNLKKEDEESKEKSIAIIGEFEQALSDGYSQLRELLATFRLTVQEANLQVALEQVIESLRSQTKMQMTVECSLPSQSLNPQELVHVLQIVREATLNAMKHSKGTRIEVKAHINAEGEYEILVQDNGVGIPTLDEPDGHYGLNIMTERSRQLNAQFSISKGEQGGTIVKITLPHTLF